MVWLPKMRLDIVGRRFDNNAERCSIDDYWKWWLLSVCIGPTRRHISLRWTLIRQPLGTYMEGYDTQKSSAESNKTFSHLLLAKHSKALPQQRTKHNKRRRRSIIIIAIYSHEQPSSCILYMGKAVDSTICFALFVAPSLCGWVWKWQSQSMWYKPSLRFKISADILNSSQSSLDVAKEMKINARGKQRW